MADRHQPPNEQLIRQIVREEIEAANVTLRAAIDHIAQTLALDRLLLRAPVDDEPYTDEQQRADAEAVASIEGGEGIPHEEILHEIERR